MSDAADLIRDLRMRVAELEAELAHRITVADLAQRAANYHCDRAVAAEAEATLLRGKLQAARAACQMTRGSKIALDKALAPD